jgi:multiple sugar transport system substrate-binding protein
VVCVHSSGFSHLKPKFLKEETMSASQRITRRQFIRLAGTTAAGAALAACAPAASPATPAPTTAPAVAPTTAPAVTKGGKVRIAVGGWAEQNMKDLLAATDFAKKTGIEPEIVLRTDTKETELTRLASAVQAGTSPYDVIDFEDELTTSFSQAGYVIGLDDILTQELWDDFSPEMTAYSKTWSTYNGETFRVIHNWEMPYWWHRKDWFDAKGVAVPKTWDDVKGMGKVFTDDARESGHRRRLD